MLSLANFCHFRGLVADCIGSLSTSSQSQQEAESEVCTPKWMHTGPRSIAASRWRAAWRRHRQRGTSPPTLGAVALYRLATPDR